MVLGKRGMRRVHLVDSGPAIGGHMRWVPQLPGLGEWGRVVNYRQIQLDKLKNVEIIPGNRLDAEGVLDYGAEIVVVATGSSPAVSGARAVLHAHASNNATATLAATERTSNAILRGWSGRRGGVRFERCASIQALSCRPTYPCPKYYCVLA